MNVITRIMYPGGQEWSNSDAGTIGLLPGAIAGFVGMGLYEREQGVAQHNALSSEISSTQPQVQQAQSALHQAKVASSTSPEARAALPYLNENLQTTEDHIHTLVAQQAHYHAENYPAEGGIFVAGMVGGLALALVVRNAYYAVAQPKQLATPKDKSY
jgi:hypothetical protein